MSRGSQKSLVTTSRGGDKNGGGSGGSGSNMKCIITVGIILPLLAAIIGVAAWSVSSDSVHRRSPPSSIYQGSRSMYHGDHVFEERNDNDDLLFGQKVPIGGAVSKDILGPDVEEERDILPPAPDTPAEKDPLYVVHYVPRGHQEVTSEQPIPSPPPDVLSKILQTSKGAGKGTPQFVVFAPMANGEDDEDDADDRSMQVNRKRIKKRKKMRKEFDYEDEYPENTEVRKQVTALPRNGYYDSSDYQQNNQGWIQNFNGGKQQQQQHQQQPQQCCNNMPHGGGMMPQPTGGGIMSTPAPSGITISLGQGLPSSPLGILRQMLRPKVDLRKKLFFGVQLENGFGFGGDNNNNNNNNNNNAGGAQATGGQTNQGNYGQMGGGGGGNRGQQGGGGGGITYTFG